ncbi:MAG: AURKAIP1/COX24 domain-containing protein [Kiritimatiellae bacterium]|nr:AURKAIP1/COX24 domain-containing protein [Kiritimatiellia bacterium]
MGSIKKKRLKKMNKHKYRKRRRANRHKTSTH